MVKLFLRWLVRIGTSGPKVRTFTRAMLGSTRLARDQGWLEHPDTDREDVRLLTQAGGGQFKADNGWHPEEKDTNEVMWRQMRARRNRQCCVLMVVVLIGWVCCFALPMFVFSIIFGWGESAHSAQLRAELEAMAQEGAWFASICRYQQYNNAPDIFGRHGLHLFRSQSNGHKARSPNFFYLYHHQGMVLELVRPDGWPYRFLELDFSERGLEPYWKNETPPRYHDIIPWADACLLWCAPILRSHGAPQRLIAHLETARDMYYNWLFFNCGGFVTYIWNAFEPSDPSCGPPSSWPVPGIPMQRSPAPMNAAPEPGVPAPTSVVAPPASALAAPAPMTATSVLTVPSLAPAPAA